MKERIVKLALPKGRLGEKVYELFEKAYNSAPGIYKILKRVYNKEKD